MIATWLSEPSTPDPTYAHRGEHILDWLARSTLPLAVEYRRFLNGNIAALPHSAQPQFRDALRDKWQSTFLELIVARSLQELGASISIEDSTKSGKRPDFMARFADGRVTVEAVSPVVNAETKGEETERVPLLNIIEEQVPEGWYVGVWELPNIGHADSKREFKRTVARLLALSPPQKDAHSFELIEELPQGVIHLYLWPAPPGSHRLAWESSYTVLDNSEARIQYVLRDKRRQVRDSGAPVLLAIHASGIGSELEDFDRALFGRTYERRDWQHRLIETGFDADGAFTYNLLRKVTPSTYAGVLAFLEVGFLGVSDPVLYLHPRFSGVLPEALLQLEKHIYDAETCSIRIERAKAAGLLDGLGFVKKV